jgi:protein gp37
LPWTPDNAAENVILHEDRLAIPLSWRQPRMVFVNSMSDLFHELVPDAFIGRVFRTMALAEHHTFQILTKRPERMLEWFKGAGAAWAVEPLQNVWLGTSIENDRWVGRADALRSTPSAIHFISAEPLLGPLPSLDLTSIDWLIVGGESGPAHRPIDAEWVRDLRDRAAALETAFFFKQWGGTTAKAGGRELDGRTWDEYPALRAEVVTERPAI